MTENQITTKKIKTLLSKGNSNAKTKKNALETFILYLAPHTQNAKGVNLCPFASKGCIKGCLYKAGRGVFSSVQQARINKTNYFVENRQQFLDQLAGEIIKQYNKAKKNNTKVLFRLNGTSDIDFYSMLIKYANLDVQTLSDHAHFYEYTKNINYIRRWEGAKNITYTFSRAEDNSTLIPAAITYGANVSVVFHPDLPQKFMGIPVIDGDASDSLMIYNKGIILGLRAKGPAKKDTTGFVISTELPF